MIIIEKLKHLRERAGVKQGELAEKLGITQSAVSQWESGLCNPDYRYLLKLADYFGVSIDEIFGRDSPQAAGE